MMTNNDSGIVFDAKSGISEEEQREILAKINNITEKNRLSLAEDKGKPFKAKKSGGRFPLIVNVFAAAALAGGLILLALTQEKTYALVRTGTKVYNSVERALIEEIRKETLSLLEAKDREIALIMAKLEEIDAELFGLRSTSNDLTAEEQEARDRLRALQEEYRSNLLVLQDERSQILEDARSKEAVLQAQLASRSRESELAPQNAAAQSAASGSELERLNMEMSQSAAVEAQIAAFFANLNRQITENSLDDALSTINSMRDFINTPAFASLRSIQARKGLYIQAINSFETMVDEAIKYQASLNSDNPGANPLSGFQARITQLEQELAEKDKTIEALGSQGSGTSRRLNELQKANSTLQNEYKQLERSNNTLQTRNNQLTTDLANANRSATNLQQSVNTLQQSVNTLQQSERELQAENARLNQTVSARDNTISAHENTIRTRESTISSNENAIKELQRQVDTLTTRLNRMQGGLQELLGPDQ